MNALYPLRFGPIYRRALWGGRHFATRFGRALPPGDDFAESWEISDHPTAPSVVAAGPLQGVTLGELLQRRGPELLGRHHPQARFPLLLKYLDARARLSVQVHPDDRTALRLGLADRGKNEAWLVLAAEPGSAIWAGFREPVDRKRVERAVCQGTLESLLWRFEPKPGECVALPAGTVHALGEGLLVAEIQTTSDNTFRLFDWNRVEASGRPRALHVEQALEAIDYRQGPIAPRAPQPTGRGGVERLAALEHFTWDRWTLTGDEVLGGDGRFHVLTVLSGSVAVEGDAAGRPLAPGDSLLLPAAVSATTLCPQAAPAVLLDAYLP